MKLFQKLVLVFIILSTLLACSKEVRQYNKWSTKGSLIQKDSAAAFFYVRKDYDKAAFLFEELLGAYRGNRRAEYMMYRYAWCKFNLKEYIAATYWFDQFLKQYPNSAYSEEAMFTQSLAFYKQADPAYLDQTYTNKALENLQLYIDSYPESTHSAEIETYMADLRERKAIKAFNTAKLYYSTYNFKGAVKAFQVLMEEYPDSK